MIYNGYVNGDWKRQFFRKPNSERMAQIARYEWIHDKDFNRQIRKDGFSRNLKGVLENYEVILSAFYPVFKEYRCRQSAHLSIHTVVILAVFSSE